MNYEIKNFIGVFDNTDLDEFCDSLIEQFDSTKKEIIRDRQQGNQQVLKVAKDDLQIFSDDLENVAEINKQFYEKFWGVWYKQYLDEYGILATFREHTGYPLKLQKTLPGQGYHIWHCEADTFLCSRRVVTWILYLNDVDEGGETEFLYQHMRVKPKKGRVVIWPAAFTHPHRGNPPLSGAKYIATGWTVFVEPKQDSST